MRCFDDGRLDYNPETGIFIWLESPAIRIKAGSLAGSKHSKGYWHIRVKGRLTYAHHLAWNTLNPNDPVKPGDEIDHINHVRDDNRAVNLEKKNHNANGKNKSMSVRNSSGVTGVYLHKQTGRWRAMIRVDNKLKHLGLFATFEDAVVARRVADTDFKFHANHGVKTNG
ncbi:MAG: HNH endonuclease [Clostridia bacterium]